jgi:hypothetical protein
VQPAGGDSEATIGNVPTMSSASPLSLWTATRIGLIAVIL